MAIKRNVKVTIAEDQAKLGENLYVYKHDRGIDLVFDIQESKYEFYKRVQRNIVTDEMMRASITVVKPDGKAFRREMLPIEENKVVFRVEHEHTDNFSEIGIYTLQIHLHDLEGNRVTIPSLQLEVKRLIADLDCDNPASLTAKVNEAMVGIALVGGGELFTIENGYVKTNWQSGDIITDTKLNKIETALEEAIAKLNAGGGEAGKPGADGKSAYELAKENGFEGSLEEWLKSLKGADGAQGAQGPQGLPGRDGQDGAPGAKGDKGEQGIQGIQGATGPKGAPGANGLDGKNIELQKSSTHVQWRVQGVGAWNNLIALSELKGDKGDPGEGGVGNLEDYYNKTQIDSKLDNITGLINSARTGLISSAKKIKDLI